MKDTKKRTLLQVWHAICTFHTCTLQLLQYYSWRSLMVATAVIESFSIYSSLVRWRRNTVIKQIKMSRKVSLLSPSQAGFWQQSRLHWGRLRCSIAFLAAAAMPKKIVRCVLIHSSLINCVHRKISKIGRRILPWSVHWSKMPSS